MADSNIEITITEETPIELSITEDTPVNLEIVATGPPGPAGSGMEIGNEVLNANPNRALFTDENGDLTDEIFSYKFLSYIGGAIGGNAIKPVNFSDVRSLCVGGFDATSLGVSETFAIVNSTDRDGLFGYTIVDNDSPTPFPQSTFAIIYDADTGKSGFLFWEDGQINNPTPLFGAASGAVSINGTQAVNGIDTDLSSDSDSKLPTVKAVNDGLDTINLEIADLENQLDAKLDSSNFVDSSTVDFENALSTNTIDIGITTNNNNSIGSTSSRKRVSPILITEKVKLDQYKIRCWLNSGTQKMKAVVYSDNAGNPDTLLAVSDELTISNTSEAVNTFTFSGVNQIVINASTTVHAGYINEANSNSLNVSCGNVSGKILGNSGSYASLASDPFGAITTTDNGPIDGYIVAFRYTNVTASVIGATATEIGYLSGVTSSIQTQLNKKMTFIGTYSYGSDNIFFYDGSPILALSAYTAKVGDLLRIRTRGSRDFGLGTVFGEVDDFLIYDGTNWRPIFNPLRTSAASTNSLLATSGLNQIQTLSTATYPSLTELSYVKGVTSAIQTQLNSKQNSLGYTPVNKAGDTGVGSLDLGSNSLTASDILTTDVQATGSAGVIIKNSGGTQQAEFGLGGGTNATINGTTNIATASADYHQIAGGTGTITDTATGSSTNININLVPKGTGRLQASGVNVPTVSSTDTLTNKTLDNTNTVTFRDDRFTLQDDADTTKQARFQASAITTGTTRVYTLPDADTTLVGAGVGQTLTNKRITPRVTTITSSATPTINTDNCDAVTITALATAITSMTTNLSGTPSNFDKLTIRIKDDGTARAITWGSSFESKGATLPTTTVLGKVMTLGFIYDTVTSKWGLVALAQEV